MMMHCMAKTFNFKSYIVAILRRASYRNPQRSEALRRARIARNMYVCNSCGDKKGRKEIAVDHINPVVPVTGWVSFDDFIYRLFCGVDQLQVLCKICHKVKSKAENKERRANGRRTN